MMPFTTTVPGYPRLGRGRAYKKLLEDFWKGSLDDAAFAARLDELRVDRLRTQAACGLDLIPCGDFSPYDHVLDTATMLGCMPERFGWKGGAVDPRLYYAMARGRDGVPPLEMTKWFDTNYHYLVPELPLRFQITKNCALEALRHARRSVATAVKPVLLGPFTFLRLARLSGAALVARLDELSPLYAQTLAELAAEQANLVQIDEPALVGDVTDEEMRAVARSYEKLAAAKVPLLVQTYYGDIEPVWQALTALPVAGLGIDFVRGRKGNLRALRAQGYPADKLLAAGLVDGRNIWRTDLDDAYELVGELRQHAEPESLLVSASCSLLHLPETVEDENYLPNAVKHGLCFAQERIGELALLSAALRDGKSAVRERWNDAQGRRRAWLDNAARNIPAVRERVARLKEADFSRSPYAERLPLQQARLNLPPLPTTTIGSFPQTAELRKVRAHAATNKPGYQAAIDAEIERVVRLQEEIGLDVLVHGEPERNDMVQFFGDQMQGFATTREGWVQSYGSRCVRPPILYGDVARAGPMTVRETALAQSLTARPMKGMLTGPVTILQWSFVREDIPREQVANQIALAIRDEAVDLERQAKVAVVQIDEPAFREGLPLRRADWPAYLHWAVRAFRLSTAGVAPTTQIHTHMCYSEFGDIIDAIAALDADVISIEDARSDGAMLRTLREYRYPQQIGPGIYDIHSPNVPSTDALLSRLRSVLDRLPAEQVWVNPDCGLKTRGYAEIVPALKNMVEAARQARRQLAR
ncbi:MAG TPA: 5-methyltetrahydropteroyltriglutamate--homocysteine S-methyltransferase [Pirellulales bacterium]|jgi:5-methyltetrahydropteroyltriglutamate--homocysteine methyltransferase|nr:5-methyltetrahydropteroyltriglutamate--homocysteine S-methyltransferase [Pirellulales bacterium]